MAFRYVGHLQPQRLNVVPFMDVYLLFMLALIFLIECNFMTLAPKWTLLPNLRAARPDESPDPERVVLDVTEDGEIYICGHLCSDRQVIAALSEERVSFPEFVEMSFGQEEARFPVPRRLRELRAAGYRMTEVLINADERVPFKHVRKILDWCADPRIRLCRISFGAKTYGPGL